MRLRRRVLRTRRLRRRGAPLCGAFGAAFPPALNEGMKILALLLLSVLLLAAPAAQAADLSLDVNVAAWHTQAWARHDLNQRNPGLGLEYRLRPRWSALTGFYRNSYDRTSVYLLSAWTPLRGSLLGLRMGAGLVGGLLTGYRRSEASCEPLALGGLLTLRNAQGAGVNLFIVPPVGSDGGFVGLQIVVPL